MHWWLELPEAFILTSFATLLLPICLIMVRI
jgi:hypothetical protein